MTSTSSTWRTNAVVGILLAGALLASAGCAKDETTSTAASSSTAAPAGSSTTATTAKGSDDETTTTKASGKSTTTEAPDDETTTTKAGKSTTTAAVSEEDQQAAEASLITTDDVPAGFKVAKVSTSDNPNPFLGVDECSSYEKAIKESEEKRTAKAVAKWTDTKGSNIQNTVEVYEDAGVAKDSAAVLGDEGFATCLESAFTKALEGGIPGATIDSLTARVLDTGTADDLGVDSVAGFGVELSLTAKGETQDLKLAIVLMTSGRSMTQIQAESSEVFDIEPAVRAAAKDLVANGPS